VRQYRIFVLNEAGRVVGVSAALFDSDDEARQWARSMDDGGPMELWAPDYQIDWRPGVRESSPDRRPAA
jgi:photosystem II stability/assembly factor-like uncharacterized protein